MKRFSLILFTLMLAAFAVSARAQAVHSASTTHGISITTGAMGSIFQPDYNEGWNCVSNGDSDSSTCTPASGSGSYPLFGLGAYVDAKYNRWLQLEAEGRWLRFNQYDGIHQDNYLIGPRVTLHRVWKAEIYGKALIGTAKMTFYQGSKSLSYTDVAIGGGADIKIDKHWSLRLPDIEYQYYPNWNSSSLKPYGASVGVGYKFF